MKNGTSGLWDDDGTDALAEVAQSPPTAMDPSRHIGCPLWWFQAVLPAVRGKGELAVALFLYRQRVVQGSQTIAVANVRLSTEIGISRFTKYRAIKNLEDAGLVTVRRRNKKAVEVTFYRRRRPHKKRQPSARKA
jgi:hypothetical protein